MLSRTRLRAPTGERRPVRREEAAIAPLRHLSVTSVVTAGAAGAAAVTAFMYAARWLAGVPLGAAVRWLGSILGLGGSAAAAAGAIVLVIMAFLWALLYGRAGHHLPGEGIVQGIAYGVGVWLLSTVLLWPALALLHPSSGTPGLFALGLAGVRGSVASLLAHGVYGAVIARVLASRG